MINTQRAYADAYASADAATAGITPEVHVTPTSEPAWMFGIQQDARYGAISDGAAAGDLVVDRFLASLRKLARS